VNTARLALSPGDGGHISEFDESRRVRESIGLGERVDLDARDLKIDAALDGLGLDRWDAAQPPRQSRKSVGQTK
jgi:hypothetical protein